MVKMKYKCPFYDKDNHQQCIICFIIDSLCKPIDLWKCVNNLPDEIRYAHNGDRK